MNLAVREGLKQQQHLPLFGYVRCYCLLFKVRLNPLSSVLQSRTVVTVYEAQPTLGIQRGTYVQIQSVQAPENQLLLFNSRNKTVCGILK